MTKNRIDTNDQTRDMHPRDMHPRDAALNQDFDYGNPNTYAIPPGVKREGYRYHWALQNIRGTAVNRIEKLISRGWEPVDKSRDTSKYRDQFTDNPLSTQYIYKAGYILLERHEKYCQVEDAYHNRETIERTQACKAMITDDVYNVKNSRR